jgi:hypothetical protein
MAAWRQKRLFTQGFLRSDNKRQKATRGAAGTEQIFVFVAGMRGIDPKTNLQLHNILGIRVWW